MLTVQTQAILFIFWGGGVHDPKLFVARFLVDKESL
jgi:hypothetical protein